MKRIEMEFDHTDPEELLEDNQHLLNEFNPENLAGASSEERILREEERRAAKSAFFFDDMSRTLEDMDVDEEEDRMSVESVEYKGDQATHNQLEYGKQQHIWLQSQPYSVAILNGSGMSYFA